MNTKFCALLALLAGLLGLGCAPKDELINDDGTPKEKTVAELLVGKWKQTSTTMTGLPEGYERTLEFTDGGTVTLWSHNPIDHRHPQPLTEIGVYRIDGYTLSMSFNHRRVEFREVELKIESISADKSILAGGVGERIVSEYTRINERQ